MAGIANPFLNLLGSKESTSDTHQFELDLKIREIFGVTLNVEDSLQNVTVLAELLETEVLLGEANIERAVEMRFKMNGTVQNVDKSQPRSLLYSQVPEFDPWFRNRGTRTHLELGWTKTADQVPLSIAMYTALEFDQVEVWLPKYLWANTGNYNWSSFDQYATASIQSL